MQPTLVVVRPFGTHAVGDVITASDDIARILASDLAAYVVKVVKAASTQTEA